MPELPEVETVRQTLRQLVLNETIATIDIHWPKIIKQPDDAKKFQALLTNETILEIDRKGKFLIFELDHYSLVSHLRMEGKYAVHPSEEEADKHTHILFHFNSGKSLHYHDVRKFGTMHVFKKGDERVNRPLNQLGPDPFEHHYNLENLAPKITRSQRVIKNILLDQAVIAGLGNIYVDEALFRAQIHPLRTGASLTRTEIATILQEAKATITEAVKQGGTTIRSYLNSQGQMGMFQQQLYAYGQTGKPCMRCGNQIEKIRVANRGTHLCPSCQQTS
ncbi:DNA-(apurinic or apyrimidinic site) lyase [Amphibacillus marinus]|uniref:Formamidopyrimidine-DNA glycosylase n=1 Tax=Amphibacillus marinus TaxID=872970 RepID=A0A1H8SUJ3_9BACI|nr:DNA-formamidopyrimidine glycosylase [Amphibacillus marinus]SEO82341.1 DNA-(apurinic or apyrimidinic site) lyase [Amphibacillus marinus]